MVSYCMRLDALQDEDTQFQNKVLELNTTLHFRPLEYWQCIKH
jgi:hypothetical protein